jgi:ferrous iron transport protein A
MSRHILSDTPVGRKVRLVAIDGGRQLSLGLSVGAEIEILHQRGSGVVVARQGNRVALGKGIAEKVYTEVPD